MKPMLSLSVLLACMICLTYSRDRKRNKMCYNAKICIHNGIEKCGKNKKGAVRRFYDTCDILEYNCLKGTDYEKTSLVKCQKLPPIESRLNDDNLQLNSAESQNEDESLLNKKKLTIDNFIIAKNENMVPVLTKLNNASVLNLDPKHSEESAIEEGININENVDGDVIMHSESDSASQEKVTGLYKTHSDKSVTVGDLVIGNESNNEGISINSEAGKNHEASV